jgi:hypothetical protein
MTVKGSDIKQNQDIVKWIQLVSERQLISIRLTDKKTTTIVVVFFCLLINQFPKYLYKKINIHF